MAIHYFLLFLLSYINQGMGNFNHFPNLTPVVEVGVVVGEGEGEGGPASPELSTFSIHW